MMNTKKNLAFAILVAFLLVGTPVYAFSFSDITGFFQNVFSGQQLLSVATTTEGATRGPQFQPDKAVYQQGEFVTFNKLGGAAITNYNARQTAYAIFVDGENIFSNPTKFLPKLGQSIYPPLGKQLLTTGWPSQASARLNPPFVYMKDAIVCFVNDRPTDCGTFSVHLPTKWGGDIPECPSTYQATSGENFCWRHVFPDINDLSGQELPGFVYAYVDDYGIDTTNLPPGLHDVHLQVITDGYTEGSDAYIAINNFAKEVKRISTGDYKGWKAGWGGTAIMKHHGVETNVNEDLTTAWFTFYVEPKECIFNPGDLKVVYTFNSGEIFNIQNQIFKTYPVSQFCDKFPAEVQRADRYSGDIDYNIYYKLKNGESITVPPGFEYTVKWYTPKPSWMTFTCTSNQVDLKSQECLPVGTIRPCDPSKQILDSDPSSPHFGTCLSVTNQFCTQGYEWNSSINQCVKYSCPKTAAGQSQWSDDINACGVKLRYTDQICNVNAPYSWEADSCVPPKTTLADGTIGCSGNAKQITVIEPGAYSVIDYEKTLLDIGAYSDNRNLGLNDEQKKAFTSGCNPSIKKQGEQPTLSGFACSTIDAASAGEFFCSQAPAFNCPTGFALAKSTLKGYYCAANPQPCESTATAYKGFCIDTRLINLTKIEYRNETIFVNNTKTQVEYIYSNNTKYIIKIYPPPVGVVKGIGFFDSISQWFADFTNKIKEVFGFV